MNKKHKAEDEIPIWRAVKEMHAHLDEVMGRRLAISPDVKCKKGCYGCCHMFATTGMSEGITIAHYLVQRPDWKDWLPRIRQHALDYCFPGSGHVTYFAKAIPCVFLNAEHECEIYPVRPVECRYHYVITDPQLCSPGPPQKTLSLDTRAFKDRMVEFEIAVFKENWLAGPLPIMVVAGFRELFKGSGPAVELVKEAFEGVMCPIDWLTHYGSAMLDQYYANLPEEVKNEDN